MYRYQIKKGAENRVFANARRTETPNIVESDVLLNDPYLDMLDDGNANKENMDAAPNPPVNPPQTTPVTPPVSPTLPPTNQPVIPPQNEQTANKEASA